MQPSNGESKRRSPLESGSFAHPNKEVGTASSHRPTAPDITKLLRTTSSKTSRARTSPWRSFISLDRDSLRLLATAEIEGEYPGASATRLKPLINLRAVEMAALVIGHEQLRAIGRSPGWQKSPIRGTSLRVIVVQCEWSPEVFAFFPPQRWFDGHPVLGVHSLGERNEIDRQYDRVLDFADRWTVIIPAEYLPDIAPIDVIRDYFRRERSKQIEASISSAFRNLSDSGYAISPWMYASRVPDTYMLTNHGYDRAELILDAIK